jgi:hypothetical protein
MTIWLRDLLQATLAQLTHAFAPRRLSPPGFRFLGLFRRFPL